ncbi:hypothetical protein ACFE04_026890 [Oxalis oulophora]
MMIINEAEDKLMELPRLRLTVGVAITGNQKSKCIVKWALEKYIREESVVFILLHVRPKITSVPTPSKEGVLVGNYIPLSQARDDVVKTYKKEIEWQTNEMLLPYKRMCAQKEVQVDVVVIESDDVPKAIAEEVEKSTIRKLVIGASSYGLFSRKPSKNSMSSKISTCAPSFCTVYAISNGKLSSIRPSDEDSTVSVKDDRSEIDSIISSSIFTSSCPTRSSYSLAKVRSPSLSTQRSQALSTINQSIFNTITSSIPTNRSRHNLLDNQEYKDSTNSCPSVLENESAVSRSTSFRSLPNDDQSLISDKSSISDMLTNYSSPNNQEENINFELEKLRTEIRHVRGMCAVAQTEAIDASRQLSNLSRRRSEEAKKLQEINSKEQEAKELVTQENEKYEAAREEAEDVQLCAEREAWQRRVAEMKAQCNAAEKEKLETALMGPIQQYWKFTWEEIVSATSSFSENLKIGMGAYGTVYKCSLHHTTTAVKVLHSNETHKTKQFHQEIEILSNIRHPHLLMLLGTCSDHSCLVYEYMENGSLEDRLFRTKNTPAIPWFDRYRIAWEVASALVFLHNSKPNPVIHRDLKPANILLDKKLVSKIGDVGLATMLQSDPSINNYTAPVGTLCYIDPEYQRSGLISPQSDVYALGVVILQLLTGKPAMGLTHLVETAIEDDELVKILDSEAGYWPTEETKEFALLGLKCAELRRRDRPDLKDHVVPTLERLKEVSDKARDSVSRVKCTAPNHFVCPLLKAVMNDPCVAADGYTYERIAIEKWLNEDKDKSPMTNLQLPNKRLLPNYTLLSAIIEWKSKQQHGSFRIDSMPSVISPQWQEKATGFFSSSGVKIKEAGQSAGSFVGDVAKDAKLNATDVAERVSSMVKTRWAFLRQPSTKHVVQEHLITAAATTGTFFRRGLSETKDKVVVGKVKVEEVAKKTAQKSKTILTDLERWQKGVASTDVFGVPIEVTVQRQESSKPVPNILVKCADSLILSGLNTPNLFQAEGDKKVICQLVSLYNQEPNALLPECLNPVDVAALAKCYLASLPEPLITFELHNEIKGVRSSIKSMRNILKKLPSVNYMTLEFVTALLLRVSQKSVLNKMDARSLAVEMAPIIIWQKERKPESYRQYWSQASDKTSKTPEQASTYTPWDMLDDDEVEDASSLIPLDDGMPLDYGAIEVVQCLVDHHNAVFTDANETVWR